MTHIRLAALATITISIFSFSACERKNEPQISVPGDDESHYKFYNCMDCHYSAGEGEGWFSVAGSANGNFTNATVELFSGPNGTGTHLASIQFDDLANFFTTDRVDFSNGAFAGIRSGTDSIRFMQGEITNGGCNMCHSKTTSELNIDY